jgi:hypothetical protein
MSTNARTAAESLFKRLIFEKYRVLLTDNFEVGLRVIQIGDAADTTSSLQFSAIGLLPNTLSLFGVMSLIQEKDGSWALEDGDHDFYEMTGNILKDTGVTHCMALGYDREQFCITTTGCGTPTSYILPLHDERF